MALRLIEKVASRSVHAFVSTGDTKEQGSIRIHRYRDSFMIWDLINAGKRGKKVSTLYVEPKSATSYSADNGPMMEELAWAFEGIKTFQGIQELLAKDFMALYPEIALTVSNGTERGIDVMPGGFSPIRILGNLVEVEVGYKTFIIRDLKDKNNLPTCIPTSKGGTKDIPVFYRWVKDNEAKVKGMSFYEVLKAMESLGLKYHQYCAMD